jgi:hypothetical protein
MLFRKFIKSAVVWALAALMVSSCWCDTQFPAIVSQAVATTTAQALQQSQQPEAPQPKVVCPMQWISPTTSSNAGAMPPTGMVSFDWTDHPTGVAYSLTIITPNGSPVNYDVNGSSKNLFLENYKQVGDYQVVATALAADGSPLCSITMNFSMPAVTSPESGGNSKDGSSDGGNSAVPIVPSVVPTPTEVEIK